MATKQPSPATSEPEQRHRIAALKAQRAMGEAAWRKWWPKLQRAMTECSKIHRKMKRIVKQLAELGVTD